LSTLNTQADAGQAQQDLSPKGKQTGQIWEKQGLEQLVQYNNGIYYDGSIRSVGFFFLSCLTIVLSTFPT